MVSDLCRVYHYTIDQVLLMPLKHASFLWGRGLAAERIQAARIGGFVNGVNIDKKMEEAKEQKAILKTGKPSAEAQEIIDRMMKKAAERNE